MSDQEELYDEFGNYIGPDLASSDDDDDASSGGPADPPDDASDVSGEEGTQALVPRDDNNDDDHAAHTNMMADPQSQIVLHEDKVHYPRAEQVYGDNVRTAVLDEDAMDLDTPIVAPVVVKTHLVQDHVLQAHDWNFTEDYLTAQLSNETTRTRRGVAIIGHLHHGKTSLVDLLLENTTTRPGSWGPRAALPVPDGGGPRYTDTLPTEQARHMSLVSTPVTTLLPDTRGKSYAVTMLDCPGHPHFHDETVAALRAVDGAVLVIDVVEGLMLHTEMATQAAIAEGLPLLVVLSKMDRLIIELKLPPRDAYYKLVMLLDKLNNVVQRASHGRYPQLSPQRGNVCFASAQHGWLFTLDSFAQIYLDHCANDDDGGSRGRLGQNLSVPDFAQRLWGDAYLDPTSRQFFTSSRDCATPGMVERTFVAYVLEPLYKIYGICLGEREPDTNKWLRSLGVRLSKDELRASARVLLRTACGQFLGPARSGWVDMVVQHVPCPAMAAPAKVARTYTGPVRDGSVVATALAACDAHGPLVMHAVKMYIGANGRTFQTLARIYSGTVRPAQAVKVLGEAYSPEDDEDVALATVESVSIPRGRSWTSVSLAKAGNWVLLAGVDANIAKTATIVDANSNDHEFHVFKPLQFPFAGGESIMKLAIEPLNPAELPKMVDGLRRVSKAYPMVQTKVEESGEHVLLGTGELYMDCVMHDVRSYSDIEVAPDRDDCCAQRLYDCCGCCL